MISNLCPCCETVLLYHVKGQQGYWFCRHCWQDMPVLCNSLRSPGVSRSKQVKAEELQVLVSQ
ncbi:hypothetical protein BST81_11120 [Leptolyngbya sp. 'hensonii']|nr:hypothetical protein BST81_11120 [Leptolyngbya sp. 'hensonii']